ncbi:MAG TPA: hypothetical protein VG820_03015 [Fimbriimonadaceae bacterium]|nr:hypothetical protein [Fimbriimonadaceae bacterium]
MLRFSRPKGPGFGISGSFYLSVLSARATLPAIVEVANPTGQGNAVVGFGVPLAPDAPKESLRYPMVRGAYGLASKDRKTVLRMLVVSKEEAGFDPDTVARNSTSLGLSDELTDRIRATWSILQLHFESHDPSVYPALDFLLSCVFRLAALSEGAIADPISQRYLLPEQVFAKPRLNPLVDAREHVAVHLRGTTSGVHAYTRGLQKFALQELEIKSLSPGSEMVAERFLLAACQKILEGRLVGSGHKIGRFEVREGGFDRELWEGIPCFELLPPTSTTATEALESQG